MRLSRKIFIILPILIGLFCFASVLAGEGDGKVEVGYVAVDQSGDQSLDHITYNIYEGFAFSLRDFTYKFDSGLRAKADLQNLTLNNRNLSATLSKPKRFSLSLRNNQYRRVYGYDGGQFTRRRTTSGQLRVQAHKNVAVFGGYSQVDRNGDEQFLIGPNRISEVNLVDYTQTDLNFGTEFKNPNGFLKTEFRQYDLEDKVDGSSDRKAKTINLSFGARLPQYNWVSLLAGYHHRVDEMAVSNLELKTDQLWGATQVYLPNQIGIEYRFLFARTEQTGNSIETDNWHNTLSINRSWAGRGGLKVSYENRIADDLTDRTVSNGFIFAGWYNYQKRLFTRVRLASRSKTVKSGVTLLGDEDFTRHLVSLKYVLPAYGTLAVSWSGRVRKNPDINSKSDYNVISSQFDLNPGKYGRFNATVSYYLGRYENSSDVTTYEFSDHTSTGTYYPPVFRNFEASIGGSYYRSRREHDLEKFDLIFGITWAYDSDYSVEAKYRAYNFDDYRVNGAYYTTNVIEAKIIRDLKL